VVSSILIEAKRLMIMELNQIMKSLDNGKLTKQHLQRIREWLEACQQTELAEAKLREQHPGCKFEYYYVTKAQVTRIVSECILFSLFCKTFLDGLWSNNSSKINLSVSDSEASQ
jgi:uncharacterized protein YbbK (DUF523 family)